MKMTSKLLKVVFAILVFSLIVPISPSVSFAKAKICCKKNCKSMMGASSQANSKTSNHGKSVAGVVPCDNDSCLITDEKSESFSFVVGDEIPQLSFSLISPSVKEIPQGFQFVSTKGASTQQQSPPLYLLNSILRI
jgi:hypothetical protein